MVSFKQAILFAFTAGLAAHAQAQLQGGLDDPAGSHHLAIRQSAELKFQGYSSVDERMPARCTSACQKFGTINEKCRVMDGVEWQKCVCTTENFEAWKSCAKCAPEYYNVHEGGFVGLFKNGVEQCAAVQRPVQVAVPDPSFNGNFVKTPSNDTTSIRMGGNNFSAASSTYIVSFTAALAVPCVLAASMLF